MKSLSIIVCSLFIIGAGAALIVAKNVHRTSIQGRITDLLGSPLSGTLVEVTTNDGTQRFSGRTDEQGNYKIGNLPVSQLKVAVKLRGFRQEEFTLLPKTGQQVLDVGLEVGQLSNNPPIEVSGIVQQSKGEVLSDATVTIVNAFNQRLVERVRTEKAGRYKVTVYDPGQYIIYASKPSFMVSAVTIVLPATLPRERRTTDFELTPFRSL